MLDADHLEEVPRQGRNWRVAQSYRPIASEVYLICSDLAGINLELQRDEGLQPKLMFVEATLFRWMQQQAAASAGLRHGN